jgi:hypothetical protein
MEVVNTTSTTDPVNMYNYLNNYVLNPTVFIIIFLIIVAYYVFSPSLANNQGDTSSITTENSINIMTIIIIVILVVLISINIFQYFFSINVTAYIQGLFTPKTNIDIVVDQTTYRPVSLPEIKFKKQVFNIPGNYYDYNDAKALCKAYGADLASYKQIEDAYKNGGEWCNYGWSKDQMVLFPTQQQTYDNLQKKKGHEHDCGRPGVNGGYIANPEIKFGVNCYGKKPKITEEEDELMKKTQPYPETEEDIQFQRRVDYWKNKVDEILLSPFNYNTWS